MFKKEDLVSIDMVLAALKRCEFTRIDGQEVFSLAMHAQNLISIKNRIAKSLEPVLPPSPIKAEGENVLPK